MKKILLILLPLFIVTSNGCKLEEESFLPTCVLTDFTATIRLADAYAVNNFPTGNLVVVRSPDDFCAYVPYYPFSSAKTALATYADILGHKFGTSDKFAVQLDVKFKGCETSDGLKSLHYDLDMKNPNHKEISPGFYEMIVKVPKNMEYTVTVDFLDACSDCSRGTATCAKVGTNKPGRMKEKEEKIFQTYLSTWKFDLDYNGWLCNSSNDPKSVYCD